MENQTSIIKLNELKELIESKKDYILIDVRNKNELQNGMIPTAHNIPLPEIEHALDLSQDEFEEKFKFPKFEKDDNLIFHCRTGGRSEMATNFAIRKGFTKSKNYAGSIWEWSEHDPNVKRYGPSP